jgi:D-psicose/D-tagatose/L-ribulose 3-epimerase
LHLGMLNWMRAEPLEVTAHRLARHGYESIELTAEPGQQDVDKMRQILHQSNVRCWGALAVIPAGLSLISPEEATRAASVDYAKRCVSIAASLGGCELTIVPAPLGKLEPDAGAEDEWQWATQSLTELQADATKQGVRLAIEPINRYETYFINRADQALALAGAVGGDCGVCLDTYHLNIEDIDPIQAIRDCRDHLAAFHVADSNRLACGMGHLNWPLIIETLDEVGYPGALSLECYPQLDRTPVNPFPETQAPRNEERDEPAIAELTEAFLERLVETNARTLLPLLTQTQH